MAVVEVSEEPIAADDHFPPLVSETMLNQESDVRAA